MPIEPKSIILGRFNYLSVKQDLFNVVYLPFRGTTCAIIARNLNKEDALNLIGAFNEAIDALREELEEDSE